MSAIDSPSAAAFSLSTSMRDAELRRVLLAVRPDVDQQRALRRGAEELVAGGHERVVAEAGVVLEEEGKAGRDAELGHRRRRERERERVLDLHQRAHRAAGDRVRVQLGRLALAPVLEVHEREAVVLAAAAEAEALHAEDGLDRVLLVLEEVLLQPLDRLHRALLGRADRCEHLAQQVPLVLGGQERARQAREQHAHHHDQRGEDRHEAAAARQDAPHAGLVPQAARLELPVEPAEEARARRGARPSSAASASSRTGPASARSRRAPTAPSPRRSWPRTAGR